MNRTLTAAVALAAGLGMAGLAHAQNYQTPGKPSAGLQAAPSQATSPAQPSSSNPYSSAPVTGTPQAAAQPGPQTNMPASKQAAMQGHERGMMRHSTVAEAQKELKSQGFYNGRIDGITGPETKNALSEFQQKNGLRKSAMLDRETRDHLNQANNANAASPQPNQTPTPATIPPSGTTKP